MKIVHVVTYVSEDGAFGGPVAVALAQLEELARQGHDVELLGGWDGKAKIEAAGVTVNLFRARRLWKSGFSGLWAPGLARTVRARAKKGAVIHIHLARDLVTLPAALAVSPYMRPAIQTHGMVMPDRRIVARLLDCVLTTGTLRRASCVLALTEDEASGIREIAGKSVAVEMIANGVKLSDLSLTDRHENEILFLARLHPRKRVLAFGEMCKILVQRGVFGKCTVVGPDEGDLFKLKAFVRENALDELLVYEGVLPTGQAIRRISQATVYVLPSTGEIFPMTVLEALAAGTPVVTTSDSGIAPHLVALQAAELTGGTPQELADAVQRILTDERLRDSLTSNGYRGLATTFSIEAVAKRLATLYAAKG